MSINDAIWNFSISVHMSYILYKIHSVRRYFLSLSCPLDLRQNL